MESLSHSSESDDAIQTEDLAHHSLIDRESMYKDMFEGENIDPPFTISLQSIELLELGIIYGVVTDKHVVIQSRTGINTILDINSHVFLETGQLLGTIVDTFGPVENPLYVAIIDDRLSNELRNMGIGTLVFFAPQYSIEVDVKCIRKQTGCDASGFDDKELEEIEQEFSDDERETRYGKRKYSSVDRRELKNGTG